MNKLFILAIAGAAAIAAPAFSADDTMQQDSNDVKADKAAVAKDNAAIATDRANLNANRTKAATDSANGSYGQEAIDKSKSAADQAAIGEKETARSVDNKMLQHHENNLSEDTQKN